MYDKPLEGIRVIDLSSFAAAAAGGRLLAEWGAEVIKLEPIKGEVGRYAGSTLGLPITPGCNPCFECNNAYKKGLALNLKSAEGQEILGKLLSSSDVFLTNNRTKALKSLGLDYETVHARYPHIVWAQLTGFGETGPDANAPGFDPVAFWARSGAMMDVTEKDTSPVLPPTGFGDRTTSCSLAAGICAALLRRTKTGEGTKVAVSLFGQAVWNAGEVVQSTQFGDTFPKSRKAPTTPIVNSYKCADGKWLFIACYDYAKFIVPLLTLTGNEDLIGDERFKDLISARKNCGTLVEALEKGFAKYPFAEWKEKLGAADVPFSEIRHFDQIWKDPQALENNFVSEYKHRDQSTTVGSNSPVQFPETGKLPFLNAPLLGEHGGELLAELGYDEAAIKKLTESGVTRITRYEA